MAKLMETLMPTFQVPTLFVFFIFLEALLVLLVGH